MISLNLNLSEFQRKAREMQAAQDQVPFALSQALNRAALNTRQVLIQETWPRYVQVRDRNFLRNALRVEMSSKRSLSVTVTNVGASAGNRGHLALHADGGTKQARGRLAMPDRKILGNRGSKGMPARLRPKGIPNSFLKGGVLYQRTGSYKSGRGGKPGADDRGLRLMYTLKPSASIKGDVPFRSEFRREMLREIRGQFGVAMRQAMMTKR